MQLEYVLQSEVLCLMYTYMDLASVSTHALAIATTAIKSCRYQEILMTTAGGPRLRKGRVPKQYMSILELQMLSPSSMMAETHTVHAGRLSSSSLTSTGDLTEYMKG